MSAAPVSTVAPSWTCTIVTVPAVLVFSSFCILLVSPLAIRKASNSGFGRHDGDECCPRLHGGALLDMHDRDGPRRAGLQLVLHLHGLHHEEGLAFLDGVSGFHEELHDLAGHG